MAGFVRGPLPARSRKTFKTGIALSRTGSQRRAETCARAVDMSLCGRKIGRESEFPPYVTEITVGRRSKT